MTMKQIHVHVFWVGKCFLFEWFFSCTTLNLGDAI